MSAATACVRDGAGYAEVVVPRPIDVVFEYVSDLRHMPIWWPSHRSYRRLAGGGGRRSLYAWVMPRSPLPFGMPIGGITIVTMFERPARFSYRIVTLGLFSRMTYSFLVVQGGTRVSLEVPSVLPAFPDHTIPALDRLAETLSGLAS
jgi:uncharacterized protein YndB with AHSA1/START domain